MTENTTKKKADIRTYPQISCAREVLSVLVERNRHNTVRGVEGFLHAIAMMDVNIDVQDSLVVPAEGGNVPVILLLLFQRVPSTTVYLRGYTEACVLT